MSFGVEASAPARVALIGAGRVGTAVAYLLRDQGSAIVGVSSRSRSSAAAAAERLGAPRFDFTTSLPDADGILIGVPDDALADVVATIAPQVPAGAALCHFSGSFGTSPLERAVVEGARGFALHPVQACPSVESALRRLPGSTWGVTCAERDRPWAAAFVHAAGGRPIWVREGDRPVWHAAAVSVSNTIAALMANGERMLGSIGVDAAHEVLGPLAAGTLENAREARSGAAILTGPVVRGETATIERHLTALDALDPSLAQTYRLLARIVVRAARDADRIPAATERSMLDVIASP